MATQFWPLYGLRITTPHLELTLPDGEVLDELAGVAADGVHDPAFMPFLVPWTDGSPQGRARGTFQHVLGTIAEWQPEKRCGPRCFIWLSRAWVRGTSRRRR